MNIKIITCHHVYNYGATLQAYALQTYLKALGHNVGFIDYRLPTHIRYELFTPYPAGFIYRIVKKIPILNYVITPLKNWKMIKTWGRKKAFDKFDKNFLNITTPTYRSYLEIKENPPKGDLFIAGSDQIWNPLFPNGLDLCYYLEFAENNIKRISYAASFGVKKISAEQSLFVKKHLEKFSAVYVRESSALKILSSIGIKATKCVDPVFLLNRYEWTKKIHLSDTSSEYIMVYDFMHDDTEIKKFTLDLAKEKKLKIIAINDFEDTPYADVQINDAGPIEFLQYLANATYVVANSFHATAFSLIFHKRFAVFPLKSQANPARMTDLLECVNLLGHFKPNSTNIMNEKMRWDEIDSIMKKDIDISKLYLDNSIN